MAGTGDGRGRLYFAFFGGGIAWTLHLILSYLLAEFACLSGADEARLLGITLIAWSLLALSAVMLAASGAAALVGWRAKRQLAALKGNRDDELDTEIHFARSGAIMSGIFALVIACQTLPIFYYLGSC
jgi:hypothetical protein